MMTSYLRPPTFCVVCNGIVLESFSVACTLEAPGTTPSDIELYYMSIKIYSSMWMCLKIVPN